MVDGRSGRAVAATPARIYLTASDGLPYTPQGITKRRTILDTPYFYTPGETSLVLPEGDAKIEIINIFIYNIVFFFFTQFKLFS